MDSPSQPATPTNLDFWAGAHSGFAAACGLVLVYFAFRFGALRQMYQETFRGVVPPLTKLVTSAIYLDLAPALVLGTLLIGNLTVRQPRARFALAVCVCAVGMAAVAVGYGGATAPLDQLAAGIR